MSCAWIISKPSLQPLVCRKKKCLRRNWSLVPKSLGTIGLHDINISSELDYTWLRITNIIHPHHECLTLEVLVLVTQSCPTFYNPMDCSPSGSSVHGIFQARILQWVAVSFSRGPSWPQGWPWVSFIAGRFFTSFSFSTQITAGQIFVLYSVFQVYLRLQVETSLPQ